MMIALLIAVVSLPPRAIAVDLVEVNHCYNATGDHVFDQLIFYSWSKQRKRYDVREWRLIQSESMYPVRKRDGWLVRFADDNVTREVVAGVRRETWTTKDPELRERNELPQENRKPLLPKVQE